MSIKDFSTSALLQELDKRGIHVDKEPTPTPVQEKNWVPVVSACRLYVQTVDENEYAWLIDEKQSIFEAAMEAVYGPNIFDWVNKRLA